jgi:hypothetical protein
MKSQVLVVVVKTGSTGAGADSCPTTDGTSRSTTARIELTLTNLYTQRDQGRITLISFIVTN